MEIQTPLWNIYSQKYFICTCVPLIHLLLSRVPLSAVSSVLVSVEVCPGVWVSSLCNADTPTGLLQPWHCSFARRGVFVQLPGQCCTVSKSGCESVMPGHSLRYIQNGSNGPVIPTSHNNRAVQVRNVDHFQICLIEYPDWNNSPYWKHIRFCPQMMNPIDVSGPLTWPPNYQLDCN